MRVGQLCYMYANLYAACMLIFLNDACHRRLLLDDSPRQPRHEKGKDVVGWAALRRARATKGDLPLLQIPPDASAQGSGV